MLRRAISRSMAWVLTAELLLDVPEGRFDTEGRLDGSRTLGFSFWGLGGPLGLS